jgi:hypothetical protein
VVIPTELSVGVVGRGGLDEVVSSYRRVLVPGAALDWSTRSEPAGDPRSVDLLEAPEQLHDLFNHEGAISRCAVTAPVICSWCRIARTAQGGAGVQTVADGRWQMDCSLSPPAKVSFGEGMQEGDLRGRYSSQSSRAWSSPPKVTTVTTLVVVIVFSYFCNGHGPIVLCNI